MIGGLVIWVLLVLASAYKASGGAQPFVNIVEDGIAAKAKGQILRAVYDAICRICNMTKPAYNEKTFVFRQRFF